jgi:flagellar biogenesis protein FliO
MTWRIAWPMLTRPARSRRTWSGIFAGLVLSAATPAYAQALGRAADDDISLWRVGSALLLCIVIAVSAAFVLKARMGPAEILPFITKRTRRLQLVESVRLGQHAMLSIVACDGREILVLTSGQSAEVVQQLPFGPAPAVQVQDAPR